ncbi:MAG: radical SAM protein [Desulfovibrionaceae bacterium]|nr:radical SAM protein [Desulfovibrionaceae bacterium]
MYRYVFGPVLSGRLGRSLGLDLLGSKVCSMDCVYCEVGPTTIRTRERKPWAAPRDILAELRSWKAEGFDDPDVVTLGGSGEPTLNSGLPEIIAGCRSILPGVPVAVLTNSSLLPDPLVRRELGAADMILPSLDSLVEEEFQAVNRPHRSLRLAEIARGIQDLRREFPGRLCLEVLLVKGYNDSGRNLDLLRDYCAELKPERVDVVTLSRPGTLDSAEAVDSHTLGLWRKALGTQAAPVGPGVKASASARLTENRLREALAASLARRPQTLAQLAGALGADPGVVRKALERMVRERQLDAIESDGQIFYSRPGVAPFGGL